MKRSENYNFYLPSRDMDDDIVDVNQLSANFETIDKKMVGKENGKGLSTNDFTNEYKEKLDGIEVDAEYDPDSDNPQSGKAVAQAIAEQLSAPNWNYVRDMVRVGLAPVLYPVGYEFVVSDSETGRNIIFVVRAHDHHKAANGAAHTMTLETKYVYSGSDGNYIPIQFDATEALCFADHELVPGTYHFTVENDTSYTDNNGKTFQFTLNNTLPEGGHLVLDVKLGETVGSLEGRAFKTYASALDTNAIEEGVLTEGASGGNLGATDGMGAMNYFIRAIRGSNNYFQSAVEQWVNNVSEDFGKRSRFSRLSSNANNFSKGLPKEFLNVVVPAEIQFRTNSIFETESLNGDDFQIDSVYTVDRKFFLLSRPEVYGTYDNASIIDGEILEYYDGLTDEERKKYDENGVARVTWLRSPVRGNADYPRAINATNGAIYSRPANYSLGVTPACIIA